MRAIFLYLLLLFTFSIFFFMLLTVTPLNLIKTIAIVYMWTPALASFIAVKGDRSTMKDILGKFNPLSYFLAPVLVLFHLFLTYIVLNPWWVDPEEVMMVLKGTAQPLSWLVVEGIVAGLTVNALVALGEEIGWRGFMYKYIKGGRLRKSIIIGTTWALWHWPFIVLGYLNFPDSKVLGLLPFTITLCALSYVLIWLRERDGVWSPAAVHGTVNALLGLEFVACFQLPDYLRPPSGLLGGAIWIIEILVIIVLENVTRFLRGFNRPLSLEPRAQREL